MSTTPTHPSAREGKPFVCRKCGGPCRAYAGTAHGWTCRQCLERYVTAQVVAMDFGIRSQKADD